jgi:hypothetical protein
MHRTFVTLAVLIGVVAAGVAGQAPPSQARVTVRNPIDLARPGETIVLGAADIRKGLAVADIRTLYVRDDAGGGDVLAQPVDVDDDGTFDELVFQADLAPGQTKTFTLSVGARRVFTKDQFRAYGRFVRERRDDFAWENDRTAHRMYGAALETWAQEPLTSSGVDVWFKRTRRLVINDWYMVDDYHRDLGEGADLYSAGKSRGCGGNAPWVSGRLWPSANFRGSRVLANGPIRVMFELTYADWDVAGRPVHERKRITLDAGQQLNRFESVYESAGGLPDRFAVGIKKVAAAQAVTDKAAGIMRTWEPVRDAGNWGCGVVMAPSLVADVDEADGNVLMMGVVPSSGAAVYYAGAAWDKAGDIAHAAAWDAHLQQSARRLAAPLQVSVASK